ncbi:MULTISPECIES: type VI secretion system protein TssA [unclassified Caballeronia]|uniref:type VI secretion system protein TssA n=1 Tax=unclassified Caballeronia TaxID=2646786 RepID=UPI00285BDC41|nr:MULTISPECIES: type VI secretion system protein TssA [unclassified Caballeronia]MDR5740969.1 type VI secretion system protein TssA [Caballeronia sp. LZ016]MDR5806867.1 type VI secretion system protein TssA [Caballeronia sp. LZ019]
MIDIEPLLAPTESMPPAGIDLEYDAAFLAFEALARESPTRQFDAPAEPPPWADVLEQGQALLARSKDLRVAVAWTRAASHVQGLAGFLAGMRLLTGLLERYWDGLFPRLDTDDDNDAALRINALAPLADAYTPFAEAETLLHDLRECEVCRVHGERLTVRDMLVAQGRLPPQEGAAAASLPRVEGILADALAHDPALLAQALELADAVQSLADCIARKLGAERAPSMTALTMAARQIAAQCRAVAPPLDARDEPAPVIDDPAPAIHRGVASPGEIATREQATAALDAVCAFLERTEPASPAPLLIRRARGLIGKDFLAVMQDLAPDSLAQIHLIAGTKPQ